MKLHLEKRAAKTQGTLRPEDPGFRDRPWELVFTYRTKRYRRSTATADMAKAEKVARVLQNRIIEAVNKEHFDDLAATRIRKASTCTLGEIVAVYLKVARIRSASNNVWALRTIIRKSQSLDLSDREIDALPATVLTKQLVRAYQNVVAPGDMAEGEAKRTAFTTANSVVRQARSIFKRELVEDGVYKEAGVRLPDLTGFRDARLLKEPSHNFVPIPDSMVQNLWTASQTLKASNPNAYRAFLLTICCGLRRAEAARANWSDVVAINKDNAVTYALRLGITKNGEPRLVPLDPSVHAQLREMAPVLPMSETTDAGGAAESQTTLLEGCWTVRYRQAFDDLSAWLKTHGWNRRKKAHELRKHFGSLVAEKYGTRIGAMILGNTEEVFRKHYDAVLQMPILDVFKAGAGVVLGVVSSVQEAPSGSTTGNAVNESDNLQKAAGERVN